MAIRNRIGYKLLRNSLKDYSSASNSCVDTTTDELYVVNEAEPLPLLDREDRLIPTPYIPVQQLNHHALSKELDAILASQPSCPGDGNIDGVVNQKDVYDYGVMVHLSRGKSSWYDFNEDGLTDPADLAVIQKNYGKVCPR